MVPLSAQFHDPFDELTDDELDEETAELFEEPEVTLTFSVTKGVHDEIEALRGRRGRDEPVNRLLEYALHLGIKQLAADQAAAKSKPRQVP